LFGEELEEGGLVLVEGRARLEGGHELHFGRFSFSCFLFSFFCFWNGGVVVVVVVVVIETLDGRGRGVVGVLDRGSSRF